MEEKRERKASTSWGAVRLPERYEEIWERKEASFWGSAWRRFEARSMTVEWRTWRARSSGVIVAGSRGVDWGSGAGRGVEVPLGGREAEGVVCAGALSWPPKERLVTDWAEWMAICRWKASSARFRGCVEGRGAVSAF